MDKRQAFEDVQEQGFGALAGGGTDQLDRVTTKIAQGGIESTCMCEYCGTKNLIGCSWDEVITGSLAHVPLDWRVDQATGTLYPFVGCANGGCRRPIIVGYAPQELKRYVTSGMEANLVQRQYVEAYAQRVLGAAQGGLARR